MDRQKGYFEEPIECMSPDERDQFERKNLREAVARAFSLSPFMKEKLFDAGIEAGEVKGIEDIEKLPLTRKSEFRELQRNIPPFGGIPGISLDLMKRVYVSPGPVYDPEGRNEDHWRWVKPLFAAGFRKGDLVQNTFAYHMTPAGHMFDSALSRLGCTVIPAGVGNRELQVRVMEELPVTGYVGTPSFLFSLLSKAEEMNISSKVKLEVALVTGERFTEEMRDDLRISYGIMARQCYGTADVGAIAYECPEGRGMHISDELIVEIVDPETFARVEEEERGEIVVTLNSSVYPLVRFGTGDLSFIKKDLCPCGRSSRLLGGILGRVDQLTKVKGMFIHPSHVTTLEDRFEEAYRIQAIVEREGREDTLKIRVSLTEGVSPDESLRERIESECREIFRVKGNVSFESPLAGEEEKEIVDRREWEK